MSITISRGDNSFQYRICPSDPLLIERKANTPGSRWCFYLRRDSVNETRTALLQLGKEGESQ